MIPNAAWEGGTVQASITAAASCSWVVQSTARFVTILAPGTGTGNGVAQMQVAVNTAGSRTGAIVLADASTGVVSHRTEVMQVSVPSAPPSAPNFLWFQDTAGDFGTAGLTRMYVDASSTFTAGATNDHNAVTVVMFGSDATWTFQLSMPFGSVVGLGSYVASGNILGNSPAVRFGGNAIGCSTTGGQFTVDDISYRPTHEIERLHVRFEHQCLDHPRLRGELWLRR